MKSTIKIELVMRPSKSHTNAHAKLSDVSGAYFCSSLMLCKRRAPFDVAHQFIPCSKSAALTHTERWAKKSIINENKRSNRMEMEKSKLNGFPNSRPATPLRARPFYRHCPRRCPPPKIARIPQIYIIQYLKIIANGERW